MSWKNPPTTFTKTIKGDIVQAQKNVALKVLRELIIVSPRDTGRFVNNWIVGLGNASENTFKGVDISGMKALATGTERIKKIKPGRSIFISNNLPYAVPLNNGHSQQAPRNFVQIAVNKGTQ